MVIGRIGMVVIKVNKKIIICMCFFNLKFFLLVLKFICGLGLLNDFIFFCLCCLKVLYK